MVGIENVLTREPSPGDLETVRSRIQVEQENQDVEIVDWIDENDPENPFNWSKTRKWILTAMALFAAVTTLTNGTMITVAHEAYTEAFNVQDFPFPNSYWPVASWAVGGGLSILVVLPVMEEFGLKWAFLGTYVVFLCFLAGQAVAQNYATLIITRFFSGGCVSIIANSVASVIADIWEGDLGRTLPVSLFITSYLVGSTLGPVIGAVIFQHLSWRWISYIQLIFHGVFFPFYVLIIRETRGMVILRQRAKRIRATTNKKAFTREEIDPVPVRTILFKSIQRPLEMFFTEPVLFFFTIWSAFTVGTIYLFTQSVEQVFTALYGWDPVQAGYVQGAIAIGECIGWFGSLLSAKLYFSSAPRNKETPGSPIPEARLYLSIFAGFFGVTGGMFIYAWTAYSSFPWIAPAIGLAMVGFGNEIVIIAIADYVVDCYNKYAGSAVAAVAFWENMFSAFLPLAAQSMYITLGFQWASTLIAFISLLLAFFPVVLVIWGPQIRSRSPFIKEASYSKETETCSSS